MIALHAAGDRRHVRYRHRDVWYTEPSTGGFKPFECLEEDRLPPRTSVPAPAGRRVEVVTYVRQGTLACEETGGHTVVLLAGDFQRATGGGPGGTNPSRTDSTQLFRTWLRPLGTAHAPGHEQKRFPAAECRGLLRVVASPDARNGSLHVHSDALLISARLEPGQHVVHELAPGRSAWLHVVEGEGALTDLVLSDGDSAGLWSERSVSFTAREPTEILLLDLGEHPPLSLPGVSP